MDQATIRTFINASIALAIFILIGLVGFFAKQWMEAKRETREARESSLQASVNELTTAIRELNRSFLESSKVQAAHAAILEEHDAQLADLYKGGACMNENCPLRKRQFGQEGG